MENKAKSMREHSSGKVIDIQHAQCSKGCNLICDDVKIGGLKSIKLKIKFLDKEGLIYIDPEFGSYNHKTDLEIPAGQLVEFYCPECGVSLIDKEETCKTCSSPMFSLDIPNEGVVTACTKKDCFDHTLKIESFDNMQIEVDDFLVRMIL